MHPEHRKILTEVKKWRGNGNSHSSNDSYLSSGHIYYDVTVPERRKIARAWLAENKAISDTEFFAVIESLYQGKSHEEKTIASMILGYAPARRKLVTPRHLDTWLDELVGWAEIDSLCQNVFTADEMLASWQKWQAFIRKLSKSTNINKRRASLVFLTGPVYYSPDQRFVSLSFEITEKLKEEKPIIITKAISWLLRSMVRLHKKEVSAYLKAHGDTLPKIAVRETERKITTGRK